MSIQSNINQMVGIGAALISQSPAAKQRQETISTQKELKNLEKIDTGTLEGPAFGAKARALTAEAFGDIEKARNEWIIGSETTKKGISIAERALELKNKLGKSTYEDYSMIESRKATLRSEQEKIKRLNKILEQRTQNRMPKKEDNVDRFYKELGGRK